MITLENVHKAMNNKHVQEAVHTLHFDWIFEPFDADDPCVKECLKKIIRIFSGHEATEEQVLAAETMFRIRVETGQAWSQ